MKRYSDEDLERMMVFCLLDRAMSYEKVCAAFDYLDNVGLTIRESMKKFSFDKIEAHLKKAGMRFPRQTAGFLISFGWNTIDLRNSSREQLVEGIDGIGYKLASMFLRNTRGTNFAIIDVHIKRWLKENGILGKNYKKSEDNFIRKAKEL